MRSAAARGLAATALVAGAVVFGVARISGRSAPRVVIATAPQLDSQAPATLFLPAEVAEERATTAAPTSDPAELETGDALRLRSLLARLAHDLRAEPFHAPTWDTELRAYARAFERSALLTTASEDLGDDETLVLGGLLAARQEVDRELFTTVPSALLERWRAELDGAQEEPIDVPGSALAFRAASALGSADDARLLCSLAEEGPSSTVARRALPGARLPLVAELLAAHSGNPDAADWALPLLQRLAQRMDWILDDGRRARTAARLAPIVVDEELDDLHRSHAARALSAWSPREAVLLAAATPPDQPLAEPMRVLLRSLVATEEADEAAALLAERLLTNETAEHELALTEDLARLSGDRAAGSSWNGSLLALLEREAREASESKRRRRALRGLRALGDPRSAPITRDIAANDPDPSVRGLAVRTLAGDAASASLLERIASSDPHPDVRRLASEALGEQTCL